MSDDEIKLATVTGTNSSGVLLRFDGESTARIKGYKRLNSYTPTTNDRVCVIFISGTYIVLGKVI